MKASFASTFFTALGSVGACLALSLVLAEGVSVPEQAAVKLERVVVEGKRAAPDAERQVQVSLAQASTALVK